MVCLKLFYGHWIFYAKLGQLAFSSCFYNIFFVFCSCFYSLYVMFVWAVHDCKGFKNEEK